MPTYPFLQIEVSDFMAHTSGYTALHTGAYIMLLCALWLSNDGSLSNDDKSLCRIARMEPKTWRRNKDWIMQRFILVEGKWRSPELDARRKKVDELVQKKSAAGNASALKRKEVGSTPVKFKNNTNATNYNENYNHNSEDKSSSYPADKSKPSINFDFENRHFVNIEQVDRDLWADAFPAVDIDHQLKRMAAWLIDNPNNRKSNYRRFINAWLTKAQDRAPSKGGDNGTRNETAGSGSGKNKADRTRNAAIQAASEIGIIID